MSAVEIEPGQAERSEEKPAHGDGLAHALDPDNPSLTLCGRIREFGFQCCAGEDLSADNTFCGFCGRTICPACLQTLA